MITTKEKLKVKFKKIDDNVKTPKYESAGAACFDLTAHSIKASPPIENYIEYGTGLSFEIPEGYVGLIFPRSSISNMDLRLTNCVGVIDSDYRGEVSFKFDLVGEYKHYKVGDRIGQMMIIPIPSIELEEVNILSESSRGNGGFGSTGIN